MSSAPTQIQSRLIQPRRRKATPMPFVDDERDRRDRRQHGGGVNTERRKRNRDRAPRTSSCAGAAAAQIGSSTGISMRPAPWALAITNDHSGKPGEAGLHADDEPPAMAIDDMPGGPADQDRGAPGATASTRSTRKPSARKAISDRGDRGSMADGDRSERQQHDALAAALQPERHREQPAHRRIEAVEQPEPAERDPRPDFARDH